MTLRQYGAELQEGDEERRELDEIIKMVSRNFARDLAAIMAAQEQRRRRQRHAVVG